MRLVLTAIVVGVIGLGSAVADDVTVAKDGSGESLEQRVGLGAFGGGFFASNGHELYDPQMSERLELGGVAPELGLRASYAPSRYFGVETEASLITAATQNDARATIWGLRVQLLGQLPARLPFTPFVVAGIGAMGVQSKDSVLGRDVDAVAYGGLGAKYPLGRRWLIRGDLRIIAAPEADHFKGVTAHSALLLGFSYDFSLSRPVQRAPEVRAKSDVEMCADGMPRGLQGCDRDPDGDGFIGEADRCPKMAETVNRFEDEDGCPDEPGDADGDGLDDVVDKCVRLAEDVDGTDDHDGCPDPDNDGDGVLDGADDCPLKAGPPEHRGCPERRGDET